MVPAYKDITADVMKIVHERFSPKKIKEFELDKIRVVEFQDEERCVTVDWFNEFDDELLFEERWVPMYPAEIAEEIISEIEMNYLG